jgi:hypothetical protein
MKPGSTKHKALIIGKLCTPLTVFAYVALCLLHSICTAVVNSATVLKAAAVALCMLTL